MDSDPTRSAFLECVQTEVPPPRTSRRPSTEKHAWLCVSSTAQGRELLKKQNRNKATQIPLQTASIKTHRRQTDQQADPVGYEPQIAMNMAKATVPSLSNRWLIY